MSHPQDQAFPGDGTGRGLTKREYIAIKLQAALIQRLGTDEATRQAVRGADSLISELNK